VFITAPDGLKLHVRCHGPRGAGALPVVCLPGLARTSADFDELAAGLIKANPNRRVIALDYRGRGRSEYDRNPDNYSLAVELGDVLAVTTALDIGAALLVGTSRGGLLSMLLATVRPALLAGVVLNDIGPVIEPKGLLRIKSYVGKLPPPRNFEEGAEILRRLFDAQFPKLDGVAWLAAARRTWQDRDGRLAPTYDVQLARTLQDIDIERPLPSLWKEFDALGSIPLMVIRGANSDVLSEDTVAAMRARRAEMETVLVPDQGHAPLLAEPDVIRRIAGFVAVCERNRGIDDRRQAGPAPGKAKPPAVARRGSIA
jgi:pimeloyl-ACP methyl ester carboxylesterase